MRYPTAIPVAVLAALLTSGPAPAADAERDEDVQGDEDGDAQEDGCGLVAMTAIEPVDPSRGLGGRRSAFLEPRTDGGGDGEDLDLLDDEALRRQVDRGASAQRVPGETDLARIDRAAEKRLVERPVDDRRGVRGERQVCRRWLRPSPTPCSRRRDADSATCRCG